MSCLMYNDLLHHHIITCGLISCVSHINTISPPKLSLNYQNQTRTFQTRIPPTGWKMKQGGGHRPCIGGEESLRQYAAS